MSESLYDEVYREHRRWALDERAKGEHLPDPREYEDEEDDDG